MFRELKVECDVDTMVSIYNNVKPPLRCARKDRNKFLRRVATGEISLENVRNTLNAATTWWHQSVATTARLYKSFDNARSDLKDSIALFTTNGQGFDERGKSAVNVLFTIIAAGAFVASSSIPLLLDEKKRFAGGFVLVFAGFVFLANAFWSTHANGILRAYYAFYVASIIDSARKHVAFGAAHHAWHEYVFVQLRRCPRDQDELIKFWTQGKTNLFYYYSTWINRVAVLCLGLCAAAVIGGLLVLYPYQEFVRIDW